MASKKSPKIRIKSISIKSYKGIDSLKLSFPDTVMKDDPDIFAIGSKNGVGKTSIIECCSLLLLALQENKLEGQMKLPLSPINIPDLIIRAGEKQAEIRGAIKVGKKLINITITINKSGNLPFVTSAKSGIKYQKSGAFTGLIGGFDLNPLLSKKFLVFHGHRKVNEGEIDPDMIAEGANSRQRMYYRRHSSYPTSVFKLAMLRSFMALSDYYEAEANYDSDADRKEKNNQVIKVIDKLLGEYSQAGIGKFGMSTFDDPSIYLRVRDIVTGQLFNIDGLSSGQKEIISTIFLIWYHSLDNPCVVFIDEPELHLNPEWHRKLIRDIIKIAPNNQYIITTHSKHVMDAVDKDRRVLLTRDS